MSERKFFIRFDGPAIENGEIDVADFAPAVLSLGELFRATNDVFNRDRARAAVKLKATHEGSFEALLTLDLSVLEAATDFFRDRDKITHAHDIIAFLLGCGALAGGLGGGVIWLIKTLKGQKPDAVKETGAGVELTIDGVVYLVPRAVVSLYENPQIREKVEATTRVLEREGIDSLSFSDPVDRLTIERAERPYFVLPRREEAEEETKEIVEQKFLEALSIHFREGNKWRFTDGANDFFARIEDADFINRVDRGEVRFLKGDVYVCTVAQTQTLTQTGLKLDYRILKVLEHRSRASQLKLL